MIRACARGIRALISLTLLAGLLVGAPAALLVIAPIHLPEPTHWPRWAEIVDLATRPDDGHLFIQALSLVAWGGWAAFAFSSLLEMLSRIRGIPAIHLPGLALPQHLAAALLASSTLAASAAVVAAPSIPERPPTAAAPAMLHPILAADIVAQPRATAPPATNLPTVTVHRGETLWRLAERHLGTGRRFQEIADLNYGRRQPDGGHLTDSHWIRSGWILRLPADATLHTDASRTAPSTRSGRNDVVVRPGDTLWTIARDHLGDPHRYPEILALNTHRQQPGGTTLTDADEIRPGWRLTLPPRHNPASHPDGHRTTAPPPPPRATTSATSTPPPAPGPSATRTIPTHDATTAATTPPARTTTAPTPRSRTATPTSPAPPSAANPTHPAAAPAPAAPLGPLLALGLGGIAAAGLVTQLRRRRQRQHQHRRPGQQLTMPSPDAAAAERRLRAAHHPDAAARVQTALATLATACTAAHRPLPRLAALMLGHDHLDLILTEDGGPPVAGFHAPDPLTWRHDPDTAPAHRPADRQTGRTPHPYPALVTLGATADALVLLNLEAAGTLTLHGPPDTLTGIQRALAVELTTSPLCEHTWTGLDTHLHDLAAVTDSGRAHAVTDPDEAARLTRTRRDALQDRLALAAAVDVLQARSTTGPDEDWAPHIHLRADDAAGTPDAWSGIAVITTTVSAPTAAPGSAPTAAPGTWTCAVSADGRARLDPLGLTFTAQHLDTDAYHHVLDLLATAGPPTIHIQRKTDPDTDPAAVPTPHAHPTPAAAPSASMPVANRGERPDVQATDGAPRVLVLGPVAIHGTHDNLVPNRRRRLTELVAYLVLHPGATYHQIDEAMWPGARVSTGTRNALVSRARRWLGANPAGEPYLAVVADGDYRLHPDVTCDWRDFQRLTRHTTDGAAPDAARLDRALALVRGRPFLGVDPRDYAWAEADTQQMISAIVDLAHTVSRARHDAGDHRGAQDAAAHGLLAEPCSEVLYRDAVKAAAARGDHAEVSRMADRLRAQLQRLDSSSAAEDETVDVLRAAGYRWT